MRIFSANIVTMKPIIIKVYLRNASVAYKKKKMLESKVGHDITWADFINVCVDQLFTDCDVTGIKQGPTKKYLNNYNFYIKKNELPENDQLPEKDEMPKNDSKKEKQQIQIEEIITNNKKQKDE